MVCNYIIIHPLLKHQTISIYHLILNGNILFFQNLIQLFPFRYMDRSGISAIADIASSSASVQIKAKVISRTLYGPSGSIVDQSGPQIHFNACKSRDHVLRCVYGNTDYVDIGMIHYVDSEKTWKEIGTCF